MPAHDPQAFGEPDIYHDDSKPTTAASEYRRVAMATMVGTTIEWYDFFIYANVAALLFADLFFKGLGTMSQLVSLATIGVSFFFRPLGAIAMGHLGDKYGRRIVLIFTLVLMGVATTLVGLLPTTAQIGIWAPILLIILRCLQGFSAGGEWGGAAMLAVEHAPQGQRGRLGAYPQIGVPVGMLLASIFLLVLTRALPKEQFDSWGWRIPFLFSVVLIFVGQYIRRRVSESPVFQELKDAKAQAKAPLGELMRTNGGQVIKAAGVFIGNNALGYMLVGGFILGYVTRAYQMPRDQVLVWVLISAALWIVTTLWAAQLSDKIGRKKVFVYGYILQAIWVFPMWWLVSQGTFWGLALAYIGLVIPNGLTYGPTPALYAEMFPARVRLSGSSIAYAIGAILGGAFAPTIAEALIQNTGTVYSVAVYLCVMGLISLVAILSIKDRTNEPLHTISGH